MGMREVAFLLGLSERHTWRILAAYRKDGAAALQSASDIRSFQEALSGVYSQSMNDEVWSRLTRMLQGCETLRHNSKISATFHPSVRVWMRLPVARRTCHC